MGSHFRISLLLNGVVATTLVTGGLVWFTFKSSDELLARQRRNEEVARLQGVVTHYDEVLTMSARMAAATGDLRWESRYRESEPVLERAIRALVVLQPSGIKSAEETDAANHALVELENRALARVRKRESAAAAKILSGPDYARHKATYARGVADFHRSVERTLAAEWERHRRNVQLLRIALFFFLTAAFVGWLLVFRKARRWNDELASVNARLDQKVKEQTAQLLTTSKMSALGEMAGGIAHEINTPLAVIRLRAEQMEECIEEGAPDADLLAGLRTIQETVTRIAKIVHGLKFFARDGRQADFQETPLAKLIEETLSLCRERYRNHGVRIDVLRDGVSASAAIECRAVEISQVLLNLLNNAYDAVERLEEKWVRIECADRGRELEISVTDSGRGVPKEIRDKLMQPFFTTKPIGKGTGLGLSISRGIVEAHRGRLRLDADGPNTKFVLTLPKRQESSGGDVPRVA